MARIAEEEIERIKAEISVERMVTAKGIELRKHGPELVGRCPFHEDRTPSLVISPEKNLWHCMGACQMGGSVIDWVMKAEGVSFRYAVELLREGNPHLAVFSEKKAGRQQGLVPKKSTVVKLGELVDASVEDQELVRQVVEYYQVTLKESPEALAYLEQRGLRNAEAIEHFRLGFANRTLGYRLPQKSRVEGAEVRGRLQGLGILRESGHEHFNGSIVVPVFDEAGRVTEMYGRKINDHLREGTPYHMYLPGPHRGVWNVAGLQSSKEVILCEALLDALTFWCAGFRNVTASYGVEGFTADHRAAFQRYGTERVWIAYDRDEAGDRAAEKLGSELSGMGIEVYRVVFPKGMDANEYAQKVKPAEKSLGMVIRQAEWMGKGKKVGALPHFVPTPAPEAQAEAEIFSLAAELGAGLLEDEIRPKSAVESEKPKPPQSASDEVVLVFGERRWRIRGMQKNSTPGVLKVNVLVSREGGGFHVDQLDMYSARQRAAYVKQASEELGVEEGVVKKDLGEVLLKLEEQQEQQMKQGAEPGKKAVELGDEERAAALELLRSPQLLERILGDFERCGVVGERMNKLIGYLAATSRKLEQPLGVVIQSTSAAGKSSLMNAILGLMPEEERIEYSAMTGQSLFYMSGQDLKHKILAIAEEEGAERASYALKLLQSEGKLTIASTGKDPATGRLVTQEYRVEGPVMIFLTTTAIEVDEELLNRCLVLTVDEGREQTRAIHELQRKARSLAGVIAKQERRRIEALHQNAQRLLRPLFVVNPYAERLGFPDHQTRTRRDHPKYLGLIETIALLHQYQRVVKEHEHRGQRLRYIEVTAEDVAMANRLAREVLGRSLDELPAQTRKLLELLEQFVAEGSQKQGVERSDFRFSRRQVREWTKFGDTQLRVHMGRLIELEYVLVHRGKQGQSYRYELMSWGPEEGLVLSGLIEVENASTTLTSRGDEWHFAGGVRGGCGPDAGGVRGAQEVTIQDENGLKRDLRVSSAQKPHPGNGKSQRVVVEPSYRQPLVS